MEKIICAAIYLNDKKVHDLQPTNIKIGFVVCGHRHGNCYATMEIIFGDLDKYKSEYETQGFITSNNRFVDRKEAAEIAFQAGQITKEAKCLISEDLY